MTTPIRLRPEALAMVNEYRLNNGGRKINIASDAIIAGLPRLRAAEKAKKAIIEEEYNEKK